MIRIVQFLNQVQAGLGGDERMNIPPEMRRGAIGPGMLLKTFLMREGADIVGTVICGDNYFLEHKTEAIDTILEMIKKIKADVVICGPALNYKRYGDCCGYLVKAIEENLEIPAFAAMAEDNTGTELFRKEIYIIKTPGRGGLGLNESLRKISSFAGKLGRKQAIGSSLEEGYFSKD